MKRKLLSLLCVGVMVISSISSMMVVSAETIETPVTYYINFEEMDTTFGEAYDPDYAYYEYWGKKMYKAELTVKGPYRTVDTTSGAPTFKGFTVDTVGAELVYSSKKDVKFVGATGLEGAIINVVEDKMYCAWTSTTPFMADTLVATWYFVETSDASIDDIKITMTNNASENFVQIAAIYDGTSRDSVISSPVKYTDITVDAYPHNTNPITDKKQQIGETGAYNGKTLIYVAEVLQSVDLDKKVVLTKKVGNDNPVEQVSDRSLAQILGIVAAPETTLSGNIAIGVLTTDTTAVFGFQLR